MKNEAPVDARLGKSHRRPAHQFRFLAGLQCCCCVDKELADTGADLAHRRAGAQSKQSNDQRILHQILPLFAGNQALKDEKNLLNSHATPFETVSFALRVQGMFNEHKGGGVLACPENEKGPPACHPPPDRIDGTPRLQLLCELRHS